MKRWQYIVMGIVAGMGLTLAGGYVYLRPVEAFIAHSPYVSAASQARFNVAVLRKLRAGDLAGATSLTEQLLALNEVTLSGYEAAFPPSQRDQTVTAGQQVVLEYRKEFSADSH